MKKMTFVVAMLALAGCTKDEVVDSIPCDVEITDDVFPGVGATNAYYRQTIEVHLTDADEGASISMDGVSGTSWLNDDQDIIFFEPDSPLSPSTDYTYTVSYCRGDVDINFRTSDLGTPVTDPDGLVGKVYSLNLQDGRVVIPEGVGAVLEQYLEVVILIKVASVGTQIEMFGALADENDPTMQDYCTQTLDFPTADFSGSNFSIGPADTDITVAGYTVTIDNLLISGDFSADGSYWGGGVLAGIIDTRPLKILVGDDAEDDAVCELVSGFGVDCVPCGDGQNYCLEIKAVDLGGELVSGDIEEIALSDCHDMCADTCVDTDGDGVADSVSEECTLDFNEVCVQD